MCDFFLKGYWAGALGSESLLKEQDVFYFFVNFEGEVHYGVNHKWKGKFLEGVELYGELSLQPLWAVFDVYGNTLGIELVDADYDINNNNNNNNSTSQLLTRSNRLLLDSSAYPSSSDTTTSNSRTISSINSSRLASTGVTGEQLLVMNTSTNTAVNNNSLGNNSINSTTSSDGSISGASSTNSVLWANSIMTTVIPTNRNQTQSNQVRLFSTFYKFIIFINFLSNE